ncbi:A/G-specific adenine glycosylase [[Clostridium] aminophilum]|uniref:A/G-specific adenine glycosylase n=1 Tax=[Clostridium] aminophilum TaxID=1526 RepID=UPI003328A812
MSLNRDMKTEMLLAWYDRNGRTLPWRSDPTPYHVWLSEIMLQQTRVEAVKEYYRRFTEALPDVRALAQAPEEQYMKLWEGLGYYSRVRNLHKAAVQIMEDHGGQMPPTKKELLALSGIGDYTSSAIASIAFGERTPAIDGNLLRVYARMMKEEENIKTGTAKKKAETWFLEFMPEDRPGDFNQAVMDLGATVCLPNGAPECGRCPWKEFCRAHADGTELRYPVIPPKKERRKEDRTILLLIDETGRIALRKRPEKGLLAGLWEYPALDGERSAKEVPTAVRELLCGADMDPYGKTGADSNDNAASGGFSVLDLEILPKAKHIFSHIEWHMTGFAVWVRNREERESLIQWVTARELADAYTLPTALVQYTEWIMQKMGQ